MSKSLNDSQTTIVELKKWSNRVRTERGWDPNAKDLAMSLSLEINELMEFFQWGDSEKLEKKIKNDPKLKHELELEVGDVVNYLCEFVDRLEIDITISLRKTLAKVEKKYPVEEIRKGGDSFYKSQKKKHRGKK